MPTQNKWDRQPPPGVREKETPAQKQRRLTRLSVRGLLRELIDVIDPVEFLAWVGKKNKAFGGKVPAEMIRAGDIGPIWDMVYRLRSGEPSN